MGLAGFYYALRYKSAPREIRIEKAASPVEAFQLAFGARPPATGAEWKRLLKRIYLAPLKRREAINDPSDWFAFDRPRPIRATTLPPARSTETRNADYTRIAREIVLMLIKRKRDARRMVLLARQSNIKDSVLYSLQAIENEAHNAAEIARRILYGAPR